MGDVMNLLITGAEKGIGLSIVEELNPKKILNISGNYINEAVKSRRSKRDIDIALSEIEFWPDVIINNYGINHLSWIGETECEDERIIETNVLIPYWIINAIRKKQINSSSPGCKVINVTSQTYRVAQRTTCLYCASKAALNHMTKVMARELAQYGWVINNFAPGKVIGTEMTNKTDEQVTKMRNWTSSKADEYAKSLIPNGDFMSKKECAIIVRKMLEMPDYVNGSTIEAFGGL